MKAITGGKGVDVVYDPVGGELRRACGAQPCLARPLPRHRLCSGRDPQHPAEPPLLKQASLVGVYWGAYAKARPADNARNFAELFGWYARGLLKPHVSETFPLERYREALDVVMNRRARGKVALLVG